MRVIIAPLSASALLPIDGAAAICTGRGVELQVLGSGGPRTLGRESETRAVIAKLCSGPVTFADDLDCFD